MHPVAITVWLDLSGSGAALPSFAHVASPSLGVRWCFQRDSQRFRRSMDIQSSMPVALMRDTALQDQQKDLRVGVWLKEARRQDGGGARAARSIAPARVEASEFSQ